MGEIQVVPVSMDVPKEGKEVVDAAAAIIEHFVLGKSLADALVLLPNVLKAVEGLNQIGEEVKSKYNDELAGYLVQKMMSAIKAKSEQLAPAPQPQQL
jgi:hypothetical protein